MPPTASTPAPAVPDTAASLSLKPGHAAVVGLQWGDEGKGQLVDLLTPRFQVTARFNGGNNAGHSVHVGDQKFALHLLPSGIVQPGSMSVIGNGVVVDPSPETGLLKEIISLAERDISVGPDNLAISDRAHVVMPYHKVEDVLYDHAVAKAWDGDPIGTTGRGIGPCYADKTLRVTAIRMGDLLKPESLKGKVARNVAIKNAVLAALAERCGDAFEPFHTEDLYQQALAWGEALGPMIRDTRRLLWTKQQAGDSVLFEGANAALLDVDHGTYPFVTSSTTSALGLGTGTGLAPTKLTEVMGVCKAYTSRVGGGPHPTELHGDAGDALRQAGNEFGTTTGRPRRVGWLDLTAVRYTAQLNGVTGLVVTGLAVLSGLGELQVNTAYELDGQRIDDFLPDADDLSRATPVYQSLPGFEGKLGQVASYDDLPAEAKGYIDFIEAFVGVPVRIACVGPKRSQALLRR